MLVVFPYPKGKVLLPYSYIKKIVKVRDALWFTNPKGSIELIPFDDYIYSLN